MMEGFVLFILALGVSYWGYKKQFYGKLPGYTCSLPPLLVILYTALAFFLLFGGVYFLSPLVLLLFFDLHALPFILPLLGSCVLWRYAKWTSLPVFTTPIVWRRDVLWGVVGCLLVFPWVMLASHTVTIALEFFGKPSELQQVAVENLLSSREETGILVGKILAVALFIPWIEEVLFRGFLLELFRLYLSGFWSVVASALIFAAIHMAPVQGWGNWILVGALFPLSLQFGYLRLKSGSIYPSFFAHCCFNVTQMLFMFTMET